MKENAPMSDTSSNVRDATGRFAKGNSGGPGRPRNPVSVAIGDFDRLGIAAGEKVISVILEQAMQGNLKAAEMVLQRVWPVRRNRMVEIEREEGEEAPYTIEAHGALANAMLTGEITPQDARAAAQVLKSLQEQMSASEQAHAPVSYIGIKR
jgi:hypothetical protein